MMEQIRKNILLVEDESILAMTEKMQLEKYGYAVHTVTTGEKAVEVIQTSSDIDLVLMDINLGAGIDGTQAAEIILKDHDIPIVFVSSHCDREVVEKTEKITSYGYVVKSSSITVLDASIKMAFKLFDEKIVRKQVEATLKNGQAAYQEQNAILNTLLDNLTMGVFMVEAPSGKPIIANIEAKRLLGRGIVPDASKKNLAEVYRAHKPGCTTPYPVEEMPIIRGMTGESSYVDDMVVEQPDGSEILVEVNSSPIRNEDGEVWASLVSFRDITESRKIQNVLRESELKFSKIFKESPYPIMIIDTENGCFNDLNEAMANSVEYSMKELIGKSAVKLGIILPESEIKTRRLIAETGQYSDVEVSIKTKTGKVRYGVATGRMVEINKHPFLIQTIVDITERKNIEADLVSQQRLYEELLEQTLAGYWDWNILTGDSYLSPAFKKMFGFEVYEIENKADAWEKLIFAEDLPKVYEKFNLHVESHGEVPFRIEIRYRHKNGSIVWVLATGKIIEWDDEGRAKRMIGCHIDITERKRVEEELKEKEEKYRFALEGSNLGEWDWNLKNNEIKRNAQWAEMLGYTYDELKMTLQQGIDLQHPDDSEAIWKAVQDHLDGKSDHYSVEYRMKTKSGSYKWIHDCGKIMERDSEGHPLRLCGTHADIDRIKNSDKRIVESNRMLNSILDSSPDVIVFALDTNYDYLAFNTMHKETIKKIWGRDIAIGTNFLDVIGNHEDRVKAKGNFDRALKGESFVVVEEYGYETLSRQSWLDYWSPIRSLDGSIIGLTCFVMNNTKQKIAQDKIESLLAEKEIILKEVHHRIKNNMNTISSLLSLQAERVKNSSAVLALHDAGHRVQSMAMLYDTLYQTADYSEMSVKMYLSSLVDEIVVNFPNSQMVTVKKEVQDFVLDTKRLQTLGIILNELMTNIMKYAFKGRDKGLIVVSVAKINKQVIISVQDDGVGISKTVSFENSTGFGLQLVSALAQQLNGSIKIERVNGTRVVMEFAL